MILQALTRYYEDLLGRGDIAAPGWGPAKISYALCLDEAGQLTQVIPTVEEGKGTKGRKKGLQPQTVQLPAAVKRTVGIDSNFLWDNSSYLLGVDQKGKPERSRNCFAAAAQKHHAVLDSVDSPVARAILTFFDTWQPSQAAEHPALAGQFDEVTSGANLLFRVDGRFPQDDVAIREAWQRYQDSGDPEAMRMQCLVTGKMEEIAAVHPAIKGVRGAQSSGAALVSFNAPAFCSYGHEQNFNAPVGKYAAFAYTAALNHLLADKDNVQMIGDTTVVCWAEGADPVYPGIFGAACFGVESSLSDNDLCAAIKRLANGLPCDDLGIDPERPFYILGLAPNAARLSVRFFLRDSFGRLMKNVNDHDERLEIVRPSYTRPGALSLWALLRETVNLNSRDKAPSPAMAGATARAVFSGTPYPVSLMEAVILRVRAEKEVTWGRAAILKAYMKKNCLESSNNGDLTIAEVAQVQLNDDCDYMPYILGRLFRVMEEIQLASADWKLKRSIKDSYFNSAASMPVSVFGKLFALSNHHLKKLMRDKPNLGRKLGNLETELAARVTTPIPARFKQEEMICFYLGYYHQSNTKKEEEKNV